MLAPESLAPMLSLEKEISHCDQCGAPLKTGATKLGCLNCLLLGGPNESGPQTRQFQHYEICLREDGVTLDELGRGAMGITYNARDINLGSRVALKVISAAYSGNPEARERFLREARAAAQVRHPNVASVFHFGETTAGQCFYAMELIEGETLEARVRCDGPLPAPVALDVAIQVTRALMAAAPHGLVHRDLKPSNIMIVANDAESRDALTVKVIDFGLAKAAIEIANSSDQFHATFSGTPEFASPEQFDSGKSSLDARSDIYSLGATLWYLLCGKAPFAGGASTEFRAEQRHRQPPLEQLAPAVPAPLVSLLRSMLATDPEARPQSARELLDALRRCREAIEAKPRRRRRLTVAAVALTLLIAGTFGLTSYFSRREQAAPAIVMPDKSIAVLPFKNLSTDPENAFFADGVQDEVLTDLAKLAGLKVISRTSAAHYNLGVDRNMRDIARELSVAYVVEGSAQRAGDRIRVSAQLINAHTDSHLWAEHYDRQIADVFAIQSEIAQQIANQLHARLSPEEKTAIGERPTTDMRAYALYTEARAIGSWDDWKGAERSMAQKVDLLEEATQRDPKFVLAWCALAKVQDDFYVATGERTHLEMAKKAVETAMQLRPDLGETRRELARYYFYANDYDRAYDELAVALRTLPNDSEALFVAGRIDRHKNRWDASLANLRKASALDPRNEEITYHLAQDYRYLRRYDFWKQDIEKRIGEERTDAWNQLGLAELKLDQGDPVGAQAVLAELPQNWSPTQEVWETRFTTALYLRDYDAAGRVIAATPAKLADAAFGGEPPQSWANGLLARARGDEEKAQAVFSAARQKADVVWGDKVKDEDYFAQIATLDAALGRKDEAIREARRAVDLMPITKDSWIGPRLVTNLAVVYAWTGERDLAIGQLESLAKIPGGPTYGNLRFNPCWDSLRGDPRFEKIVASLAPKSAP
jgi:serine/threonine protein kinase/Tfp pilus assembly protein PilF